MVVQNSEIAKGAEASVFLSEFLGRESITKTRFRKEYRQKELDDRIRSSRLRNEAKLLKDARKAGVRTPVIYDIDIETCSLVMERVRGRMVKEVLENNEGDPETICSEIGKMIATLHNSKICHGDLTTSNMMLTDDGMICLLDISMGSSPADQEDMGVDIHLFERAFISAHPELSSALETAMRSYVEYKDGGERILEKVEEIKGRGRYT